MCLLSNINNRMNVKMKLIAIDSVMQLPCNLKKKRPGLLPTSALFSNPYELKCYTPILLSTNKCRLPLPYNVND